MSAGVQLAREAVTERVRINWTRVLVVITTLAMMAAQVEAYGRLTQRVEDLHEQVREIRLLLLQERGAIR